MHFIISRLSNLLFSIQKTDGRSLVKFDLEKYLSNENLDLSFYEKSENKIWGQIKKSIGEENARQFQKAIAPLESIFTSHWRKTSNHLLLWRKYFQSNQSLFRRAIFDVKKLSGIKHFPLSRTPIYLISDTKSKDKEIHAWFSWTPKRNFIVVEIPISLKTPNNLFPVSILTHEFFHLILRENKNLFLKITKIAQENKKILTKLSEGMPNRIFLEELLISSFIPEGYLGEKHFHTKIVTHIIKPKNLLAWRKLVAFKLNRTAKEYINSARQIDEKYLKDLIKVIKQNEK
jgi:hypothetical protein